MEPCDLDWRQKGTGLGVIPKKSEDLIPRPQVQYPQHLLNLNASGYQDTSCMPGRKASSPSDLSLAQKAPLASSPCEMFLLRCHPKGKTQMLTAKLSSPATDPARGLVPPCSRLTHILQGARNLKGKHLPGAARGSPELTISRTAKFCSFVEFMEPLVGKQKHLPIVTKNPLLLGWECLHLGSPLGRFQQLLSRGRRGQSQAKTNVVTHVFLAQVVSAPT